MNFVFRCGPLLALSFLLSTARAQEPIVVTSGGAISLPLPAGASKARVQVRLGNAVLDDEPARIEGGALATKLEADPGRYTLRLASNDKARTALGADVPVIVPGIRRTPGVWGFNGSLWAEQGHNASTTPQFLSGLKRDDKRKLPLSIPFAGNAALRWDTFSQGRLEDWFGEDSAAKVHVLIKGAPDPGAMFVAQEVTVGKGDLAGRSRDEVRETVARVRRLTSAWSADAALVLVVDNPDSLEAAQQITLAAPFFDAVVLKWQPSLPKGFTPVLGGLDDQLWPLKMARRVSEEQPNFDLPVWVDVTGVSLEEAELLQIYQSGASGFIAGATQAKPAWVSAWERNANWLSGAVTLEDAALWPSRSPELLRLLGTLRQAGRVPLVGRLPGDATGNEEKPNTRDKSAESVFVILDANTTADDIRAIERGATNGGTIYVEGLPAPALWDALGKATGTGIAPLPAPREELLTLDDPWTWGTLATHEFKVSQLATVTIKGGSLAAQAREKRGEFNETKPRTVASLNADPNGFLICPVGRGHVFWLPHRFRWIENKQVAYYSALAGTMQAALGSAVSAQTGDPLRVRLVWRATPGKSGMMALFNPSDSPIDVPVMARAGAEIAVNLLTDADIPTTVRGFETRLTVSVPANGYAWVAFNDTRDALNKERATTTIKARLK